MCIASLFCTVTTISYVHSAPDLYGARQQIWLSPKAVLHNYSFKWASLNWAKFQQRNQKRVYLRKKCCPLVNCKCDWEFLPMWRLIKRISLILHDRTLVIAIKNYYQMFWLNIHFIHRVDSLHNPIGSCSANRKLVWGRMPGACSSIAWGTAAPLPGALQLHCLGHAAPLPGALQLHCTSAPLPGACSSIAWGMQLHCLGHCSSIAADQPQETFRDSN